MDGLIKNMDFLVRHWAPFPRRFPSAFRVITSDFIREKDHWMRTRFSGCNFSLILRGRGEYRRKGRIWAVHAPCVITQWPGEYLEYGPPVPEETWDELYVTYESRMLDRLKRCGFVNMERPVWPIADLAAVNAQLTELEVLAQSSNPEAVVDRVDRIWERLILETLLHPQNEDEDEQVIPSVMVEMRRDLGKEIDFNEVAARNGMSLSTFRRRWFAVTKAPPSQYLQQLRMREACRLLVETSRPIYEVAHAVGFEDELYFSRRFHKEMQMAPRDYRRAYKLRRADR